MRVAPPRSEAELLERASGLAGLPIAELASRAGLSLPQSSRRGKGFAGTLLERLLGASAASLPEPDFQLIGVELKTLPIDSHGRPQESTYVCSVPLHDNHGVSWETSVVHHKLQRVLWLPLVVTPGDNPGDRVVGAPLLWSPDAHEEAALRSDFEELMDLVVLGQLELVTAQYGRWLQIRPKGASSRSRTASYDTDGKPSRVLPRGFYLRTQFTTRIIQKHYLTR